MVLIPNVCIQLLDIGMCHEPSSHVTIMDQFNNVETHQICFTPILNCGNHAALNLTTLDVVDLTISTRQLKDAFKTIESVENKLSVIHYLLVHQKDTDTVIDVSRTIFTNLSLFFEANNVLIKNKSVKPIRHCTLYFKYEFYFINK